MTTRNYFIREIPSWASWDPTGFGSQYRNSYMFSIPAKISVTGTEKMNSIECIIEMGLSATYNGADFSDYAPKPAWSTDVPGLKDNYGIMAGLFYHTVGTTPQTYGKITAAGDLVYFNNLEDNVITSNTVGNGWTLADYTKIGWGSSILFKARVLDWCQRNIHETFSSDDLLNNQVWTNVNIVINTTTNEHLIYPGNDPLATESTSLADITDRIIFSTLTNWTP